MKKKKVEFDDLTKSEQVIKLYKRLNRLMVKIMETSLQVPIKDRQKVFKRLNKIELNFQLKNEELINSLEDAKAAAADDEIPF